MRSAMGLPWEMPQCLGSSRDLWAPRSPLRHREGRGILASHHSSVFSLLIPEGFCVQEVGNGKS